MTAKETVKQTKPKKVYPYELRYTDIRTARSQTRKFDTIWKAREWAIEKLGPELKINGLHHALSNGMMESIILVKGPDPEFGMVQLLVNELPPEPPRKTGFKVNTEKRNAIVKRLEEVLAFDEGDITEDIRTVLFKTFHIALRKKKEN